MSVNLPKANFVSLSPSLINIEVNYHPWGILLLISSCLGFGSWTLFEPGTPICFPSISFSTYPIHASPIWRHSQKTRRWVEQACKHARWLLYRANKGKVISLAHRSHIIKLICINITTWLKNPNRLYQKFLCGLLMCFSAISFFFAECCNLVRAIRCTDNKKFIPTSFSFWPFKIDYKFWVRITSHSSGIACFR